MLKEIENWMKNVTFQKKRFGGIDEADVWKKIEELNAMYEKMLLSYGITIDSHKDIEGGGRDA